MKYIFSIILSTCLVLCIKAQAPQGFNYQGVARNASGLELPNQSIGLQLSVLDGSSSGTVLYTETHVLLTDANGLFTLTIGLGTPTFATFSAINWATGGSKWLKVSLDATGGTSYQLMGTSQLLSVPYALFAGNVANNGGKQTLVLSDDVTDSQAVAIIATEVGPNTQEIKIVGTTNLTTVDLSMITTAINIEVSNNSALTSVNFSGLTRCDGSLTFQNSPNLTTINLSSLVKITTGNFNFINTGLTNLNYPSITKINAFITIRDNLNLTGINLSGVTTTETIHIYNNTALSSIDFSGLTNCSSYININTNVSLSGISFPALTSTKGINIGYNAVLTSLNLSSLAIISGGNTSFAYNGLTSLSLPALTSFSSQNFHAEGNKLTVSAINSLLNNLVSISPSLTGKLIDLSGQTPAAPPSGQGITDKATLISNGNGVTTD